jgi:hypothetical protein
MSVPALDPAVLTRSWPFFRSLFARNGSDSFDPLGDLMPSLLSSKSPSPGRGLPRLRGGCWFEVEQAEQIRDFTVAHIRMEVRRTQEGNEAELLTRALREVVDTHRTAVWWTARHINGAVAAVHEHCLSLVQGREVAS